MLRKLPKLKGPRWHQRGSAFGFCSNGVLCLALGLIALHVFGQPLVYDLFALIGMTLVTVGAIKVLVLGQD